jgi:hypothetical protein
MKGRKHRATGGVNEDAQDKSKKNLRYTYQSNVNDAAEERKSGGRAGHMYGGPPKKAGGKVHGAAAKHHAGRKARKSGGRASCESNPFTSAKAGKPPPGRTMDGNVGG